jgi:hypothetical protein
MNTFEELVLTSVEVAMDAPCRKVAATIGIWPTMVAWQDLGWPVRGACEPVKSPIVDMVLWGGADGRR